MWYGGNVGGWIDPLVFINFFGVVVFVAGFLVSGIILDYKEAEKIPEDLFSALEGLTAALQVS